MLAAGLSTLFVMDKKQAYIGGTFLFIFLILALCSMGGWCFPSYAPFGEYWSTGPVMWPGYMFGGGFGGGAVIIEDNDVNVNNYNDYDGGEAGDVGEGGEM